MFPLNTVLFPGVTLPLHVFEDRYRALVHHLLSIPTQDRLFGIVAIREGYEVGEHGAQSMHRVGCVVQLTEVEPHDDGRFDIEVVGRQRMRLEAMDAAGEFLRATCDLLTEPRPGDERRGRSRRRTVATFEEYRGSSRELRGGTCWTGRCRTTRVPVLLARRDLPAHPAGAPGAAGGGAPRTSGC